jgi:hypothetical protein
MAENEKRSTVGRRSGKDRRSGLDTRSNEERKLIGERRSKRIGDLVKIGAQVPECTPHRQAANLSSLSHVPTATVLYRRFRYSNRPAYLLTGLG